MKMFCLVTIIVVLIAGKYSLILSSLFNFDVLCFVTIMLALKIKHDHNKVFNITLSHVELARYEQFLLCPKGCKSRLS